MAEPTKLTWKQANEQYGVEHLQAWNDHDEVIVHEAGAVIQGDLDFDDSNHVAVGDLTVEGNIENHDWDAGGFLVVLGSCRAKNVVSGGGQMIVTGDLVVDNAILCSYNHGWLEVRGDMRAGLIAAEHATIVKGSVTGTTIDFGGFQVEGEFEPDVTRAQATHGAKETFVPEVINSMGYVDGGAFNDLVLSGEAVLKGICTGGVFGIRPGDGGEGTTDN
jgi:hypothetical protein